jgi:hypothetical protein
MDQVNFIFGHELLTEQMEVNTVLENPDNISEVVVYTQVLI